MPSLPKYCGYNRTFVFDPRVMIKTRLKYIIDPVHPQDPEDPEYVSVREYGYNIEEALKCANICFAYGFNSDGLWGLYPATIKFDADWSTWAIELHANGDCDPNKYLISKNYRIIEWE